MKKLFFAVCIALLAASCNNDDMNDENPYPDGVYPFEVSGVSHTSNMQGQDSSMPYKNFIITWTPPSDNGFSLVQIELYSLFVSEDYTAEPILIYSSSTGYVGHDLDGGWVDKIKSFVLDKNKFSYNTFRENDKKYVIIKCVDKFGNVSNGVKYEFSWND